MSGGGNGRRLLDDCFLHDRDRMRHHDVLALLEERLSPVVGDEFVALDAALGRFLSTDVIAPRDVPLHDNAAVDGYAFAYADYFRRNTLGVRARIAAGDLAPPPIGKGEAARIFTGAVMPEGADTVAMQEDCETVHDGTVVTIAKGLKPGANRRRAGEDVKAGTTVLTAGRRVSPADVGALASLGLARIGVRGRLKVAILSTGNELVEPGEENLAHGQVFDSNRAMLKALSTVLPLDITDLAIAPDREDAVASMLADAAEHHDVILTSGGASRGEEDHIVTAIDRLGTRHLWQIAVKPGRPMSFGQIRSSERDCVILGLPGNPVAVFVCFLLYVRPALAHLGGGILPPVPRFPLPAAFEIGRKKTDRREFLRGWLSVDAEGRTVVEKFARDGSGLITGLRQATGLIELPEEVERVRKGDIVSFLPLSGFGISA
jgi:molybdopterin molybdotransferase